MNNIKYYYQQKSFTITAASQMPMTTENEQRVNQERDNYNASASVDPKPSFTYISLIGQAILAVPGKKLQLNDIRIWIANTYPFYKMENKGWQNAIRHYLTLCPAFRQCERDDGKRRKKAWTIPDEYQEYFINGVYINYKAKEIKAREENASTFGSGETISSSINEIIEIQQLVVPELISPHSQELSANQSRSPRLSTSFPNLSTAPAQPISGSCQSGIACNTRYIHENSYIDTTETSIGSSQVPYNYVNMAEVENIQDNRIMNYESYEIKETEAIKIEMSTWEEVTEYCCDTRFEYDQMTYFESQLNLPGIYDCPDYIYIGCTDPEKLVQVAPGTHDLGYICQDIFNP
ncbi:hypothetical protein Glove_372g83 [Diversispora epigaea]|uniref:Fork-head domain-containing protein n=1 Tax=Diversispora epigaea TaxID=1348612 RepID=A0A397HAT0_9GLOM|nr:hypothetical protein Glove_372g83 [Diversispora epigaea]